MEESEYMAKMRVHELARELGIENKQIIELLSTTEYAVKSHSSNINEDAQKLVRQKLGKPAKAPEKSDKPESEKTENAKPGKRKSTAGAGKKPAEGENGGRTERKTGGRSRCGKRCAGTAEASTGKAPYGGHKSRGGAPEEKIEYYGGF